MDHGRLLRGFRWCALATMLLAPAAGCASGLAAAIYLVRGYDVPAKWDGLTGKRVVVVCRAPVSFDFRDSTVAEELARQVGQRLGEKVRKSDVISHEDVAAWTDENVWHEFSEIGRALEADYVVGIELMSYSLHQGQTIFQGKSTYRVQVIDVSNGNVAFEEGPVESTFPPNTGVATLDRTERDFRRQYLGVLADDIGSLFYSHDKHADIAQDTYAFE
jgi:hypothetical protein